MNALTQKQALPAYPINVRLMARSLIQKLHEYRRIRSDKRQLQYLSDHLLRDMGIADELDSQILIARQMRTAELLRLRQI